MSVTMFVIFVDIKGWQVSSFFDDLNQEVVKVSLAIDVSYLLFEGFLSTLLHYFIFLWIFVI